MCQPLAVIKHVNLPEWRDPFAAFLEIRTPSNVAWPSVMDPQTVWY